MFDMQRLYGSSENKEYEGSLENVAHKEQPAATAMQQTSAPETDLN